MYSRFHVVVVFCGGVANRHAIPRCRKAENARCPAHVQVCPLATRLGALLMIKCAHAQPGEVSCTCASVPTRSTAWCPAHVQVCPRAARRGVLLMCKCAHAQYGVVSCTCASVPTRNPVPCPAHDRYASVPTRNPVPCPAHDQVCPRATRCRVLHMIKCADAQFREFLLRKSCSIIRT